VKIILTFLALVIVYSSTAQEEPAETLKVGLVLSGGGAKGLAHIGAIKVLDSLGVKIDYIAGTSMGAVVGSLYAAGYSGKQMDSIFSNVNFDDIINDKLPRASKTFYERESSEKYAILIPFNNFKIQLPSALSRGQNVFNLLSKLTLHVSGVNKFDQLPIPFFCIATNVETGAPIILDQGSLPQAVAASGAFPTLFQPVIINDQALIDGGVANNYPIDELKAKGMDVIIGVDVQDDLSKKEALKSAPEILLQINNYRTIRDMKVKSKKTDVYIKPDIKGFTVISFNDSEQIIERGRVATLQLADRLKQLSRIQSSPKLNLPNVPETDSIPIKNIKVLGNDTYTRAYVLGKLKLKSQEKVSYRQFNKGVNNLVATNNFDSFLYRFKPNNEGYDLIANVHESDVKTHLKLGLHYDDLYKSGALLNISQKRILFNNDVASVDLVLGDNIRYEFEYYIDKGFYWSIGLKSRYNAFHKSIGASLLMNESELLTTGLNKIEIELSDITNQFYLQTLFRKDLSLIMGAEHKKLRITSETLIDNIDPDNDEIVFENSDFVSVFGKLKFDTYDNKYFPNEGFLFDSDMHLYLSSSDFNNNFAQFSFAKAKVGYALSFSDKFSAHIVAEGGFRVGDDSNNSLSFALGGYGNNFINNFISFYGYDYVSIIGDSFVKSYLNIDYELVKNHHINFGVNYANIDDKIFETGEWFTVPTYSGYAIGYAFETFFGPIEAKYSWSPETGRSKWFFNMGFWF